MSRIIGFSLRRPGSNTVFLQYGELPELAGGSSPSVTFKKRQTHTCPTGLGSLAAG
jgi:hypothetical protein